MSYAVALRANNQDPDLDKIKFGTLFSFKDDGLKRRNIDCDRLLKAANVEPIPSTEVLRYARLLRNSDPNSYIRGKLIAQFVMTFCRELANRFADKKKINGKNLIPTIEFGKNNLISSFVDFINLPDRLSEFFEEMEEVLGAD